MGEPWADTTSHADIPLRTAQRWVANYKKSGLTGLCRSKRKDRGTHKIANAEVQKLIEGLALEYARAGDTLVVWDISAFSSDTQNFVDIMQTLQQRNIGLQILAGNFSEIKAQSWSSQVMLESYSILANLEHKYLS